MADENQGYLEAPYLDQSYLADTVISPRGLQFTKVITPNVEIMSLQWVQEPKVAYARGVQVSRYIQNRVGKESLQFTTRIYSTDSWGISFLRFRKDFTKKIGLQTARYIKDKSYHTSLSFRMGKLRHEISEENGYMMGAYLYEPYLAPYIKVSLSAQYKAFITRPHTAGLQFTRKITPNVKKYGLSFKKQIANVIAKAGISFDRLQGRVLGLSFTRAIYNTTNLRVLMNFPSRGLDGYNWTTNSQSPGDFSPNNLNTDIVEQVWRSFPGTKAGITLKSDTGLAQGAFIDTFAILNHNMTTSANVVLQGSNDSNFSSAPFSQTLFVQRDSKNLFWISPTLPNTSYRYWRILINDSTNPAAYIEIGTVIYGSAIIMTEESFTDQVRRRTTHYKDVIRTEGQTNVSNDRGIKSAVTLSFRNINFGRGNYMKLRGIFDTARTSLKCLWIPTPANPNRFAVFGKLTEIPEEEHNYVAEDADYIDFTIEVDEGQ